MTYDCSVTYFKGVTCNNCSMMYPYYMTYLSGVTLAKMSQV